MGCPSCGAENRAGRGFCGECGAALPAACPSCGFVNEPNERFCGGCGQRTAHPPAVPSPQAAPPPQSYTPRHLAEKSRPSRDTLEGERKQVTILFADVVGSTALIQGRDDEEAQRLLDGAVQHMVDAVHRYEGTVSRRMGDGLMAMFGAPVAHEDHAVRASFAALAMLEAARAHGDEARAAHGADIKLRVGLNSGGVIVRLIANDRHLDYTAMGETVHLASRMEQLAAPGTALASAATRALIEGFVEAQALGHQEVKGFEQPVEVFELVGAGIARSRFHASAGRGLTPFVGRQEERAAIDRALARAQAGQGQVMALVAEAGVGKSRLVREAIRSDAASGFRVLQTGAVSYGQTTAWLPVSDLLRTYFHIESRDDHTAMRAKVIGGVQALEPGLDPDLPALLSLLDVPVDDDAWTALDPPRRRAATLDAVRRLVLRESRERPLLLVFEDLHWIDAETQALLDGLVEALPTARVLLLVNYRPEYAHAWGNKSYYTQVRPDPFGQASAEEMLDGLLGHDPTVLPLMEVLVSRTEGNPFFLEEGVQALAETGALLGERGAYRLTRPVEDIRVPATVQAVLAARIDRLPPGEKQLLQTASVIGKDVPFSLLRAIADLPDEALHVALSRLQAAELLHLVNLYPEPAYTFKHALTHDVAYGSLLQERRRALHGRIVDSIESLHPDRLAEHVERLAHHGVRAERWDQAVAYCRQATSKAMARWAFREAATFAEQALVAVDHLPESPERLALGVDLRLELRGSLNPFADHQRIFAVVEAAESLAVALDDPRRLATVNCFMASHLQHLGQTARAVEYAERAVTAAESVGDAASVAIASYHLGQALYCHGDLRRARDALARSVASLPVDGSPGVLGMSTSLATVTRQWLGHVQADLGELDEALATAAETAQIAAVLDQPYARQSADTALGHALNRRGAFDQAIPVLERALALAEAHEIVLGVVNIALELGYAYACTGRAVEGIALLEGAISQSAGLHIQHRQALRFARLSAALLAVGRLDEASRVAAHAVDLARANRERGWEACALEAVAWVLTDGRPVPAEGADAYYRQALNLSEELGLRPLQAHCHLGLGKLYLRTGRPDEARIELARSIAMLREMGMTFWLPEAESELAQSDGSVPGEHVG